MGREIERLIQRLLAEGEKSGFDLGAMEGFVRERMHHCGAIVLSRVLAAETRAAAASRCPCGGTWRSLKRRGKTVLTVLGEVRLERIIQRCDHCGATRAAEDEVLDVVRTGFSPGVRRMMARTGEEVPFDKARDLMWELAGVRVTDKDVERKAEEIGAQVHELAEKRRREVFSEAGTEGSEAPPTLYIAVDGTGVPVLKKETEGRKGKGVDQVARSREAKLGALFTQTGVNKAGEPVRDPGSTTYVGRIESAETFGPRLYAEAVRRGHDRAKRTVLLGDGAPWIWNLADWHFPGACQIVDYYHAKEHLGTLAGLLFPQDEKAKKVWRETLTGILWAGEIERLVSRLRAMKLRGPKKEARDREADYFEHNKKRMRYAIFRAQNLFIGSGVVEAGCKTLIGRRLKQSGMHWTVQGANDILALRCSIASGRFEDYWVSRRAA